MIAKNYAVTETICIVAIIKDEEKFIDEWIAYHRLIGVDYFFIYDDGPSEYLDKLLIHHSNYITIVPWQDQYIYYKNMGNQIGAYIHSFEYFIKKFKWVAFLDIDEFIVLRKHSNIKEFLSQINEGTSVSLNWHIFGHNGFYHDPKGFITSSLTRRMVLPSKEVKSITQTDAIERVSSPHYCNLKYGKRIDANQLPYSDDLYKGKSDIAHINHYQCRSFMQWMYRVTRGDVNFHHKNCPSIHLWRIKEDLCLKEFVTNIAYNKNEFEDEYMIKYKYHIYELINDLKKKRNNIKGIPKELCEEIDTLLKTISQCLITQIKSIKNIGLSQENLKIVLFLYYYSRYKQDDKYINYAENIIEKTFEELESKILPIYVDGLAGLGTTIEHLVQNSFIKADTDEVLEDVDMFLRLSIFEDSFSTIDLNLLLTEIGKYFVIRLNNRLNTEKPIRELDLKKILNIIIEKLNFSYKTCSELLTVLDFLAKAYPVITSKSIIIKHIDYTISELDTLIYKNFLDQKKTAFNPLSIAIVLSKVAEATSNTYYLKKGKDILIKFEKNYKRYLNSNDGSASMLHLKTWLQYKQLYIIFEDENYKKSAIECLSFTVQEAVNYLNNTLKSKSNTLDLDATLSLSDIGLTLLAAVDKQGDDWIN